MKRKKTKEDLTVQFIRIANTLAVAMNKRQLSPERSLELIKKAREAAEIESARLTLYPEKNYMNGKKKSMPVCK